MVRAGTEAAYVRRANSSRAGVFGSSGWASGGSGFGSTLPLSCADAALAAPITNARAATRARLAGPGRRSAVIVLDPFVELVAAPGEVDPHPTRTNLSPSWPVDREIGSVKRNALEPVGNRAPGLKAAASPSGATAA